MKLFISTRFAGHFPVGCAAVIAAPTKPEAKKLLEAKLASIGLEQRVPDMWIEEVDLTSPEAYILADGDY